MDEILSIRPVAQLENADSQIQTYILLLEKKLKNCVLMHNINKEMEIKYSNLQEELYLKKMENKRNSQREGLQKNEIEKLHTENANLDAENKTLKQFVVMLQNEIEQLKKIDKSTKNTASASNTKEVQQSKADNDPDANSVVVKGFTEHQLNSIPKINIINLGRLMEIKIMGEDILKVSKMERKFYERHNLKPDKIILIVKFRKPDLKVEFLKKKEKLKLHSRYDDIEINDYVSDEVYNLYQYAKILKTCGYTQIFWRNNCVYVKKTPSSYCEPILIKSKSDVDALKVVKRN